MRLAMTLSDPERIGAYAHCGADVFIVGLNKLTHRFEQTFSLQDYRAIQEKIHQAKALDWVSLNGLYHPGQMAELTHALDTLAALPQRPDRILFADPAVYRLAKPLGLSARLIYQPETYIGSSADIDFWHEQNIAGVVPARETTLIDLERMGRESPLPLIFVGHGYLNMFHSRRPLVRHYLDYTDTATITHKSKHLFLQEETRSARYPIMEDAFGTHVFRERPLASFAELPQLSQYFDTMIIQGLFIPEDTLETLVQDYRALLNGAPQAPLIEKYASSCDQGFYYKTTVWAKKGSDEG